MLLEHHADNEPRPPKHDDRDTADQNHGDEKDAGHDHHDALHNLLSTSFIDHQN